MVRKKEGFLGKGKNDHATAKKDFWWGFPLTSKQATPDQGGEGDRL